MRLTLPRLIGLLAVVAVVAAIGYAVTRPSPDDPSARTPATTGPAGPVVAPQSPGQRGPDKAADPKLLPPPETSDDYRISRLLGDHENAAVDAELARIRKLGRQEGSYDDVLTGVVRQLVNRRSVRPELGCWCEASPPSAYAFYVRGALNIRMAWEARGGGWAASVSEEGGKTFADRLKQADRDLARALKLDPTLVQAATLRIIVAGGGAGDAGVAFERALKIDPTFVPAYFARLQFLLPRWGGSVEAMLAFIADARKRLPDEPAVDGLVVFMHDELSQVGSEDYFKEQPRARAEIDSAFDRLIVAYPRAGNAMRSYYKCLGRAGDRARSDMWLKRAAEAGHAQATFAYGGMSWHRSAPKTAHPLWVKASMLGHGRASTWVGYLLAEGKLGFVDEAAALAWFRRGAELGDNWSMSFLGEFHAKGRGGVARNPLEAVKWYRAATRTVNPDLARGEREVQISEDATDQLRKLLREHSKLRKPGDPE